MPDEYNTIILIFDTLRADYLSCYGSDLETSVFDCAADQGTVFESAFSTAPGTPISHASLYSGQYPSNHGVTGQYIPLPDNMPVIVEWFQNAGYDTFGITGPSKMGSEWEYDRGFNELFEPYADLPPLKSLNSISESITNKLFRDYFSRRIIKGGKEKTRFKFNLLQDTITSELERPFFSLCNFTTVHAPYDPPRPYKQQATPDLNRSPLFLIDYIFDNISIDDPDIRLDRIQNLQTADGIGRYLGDFDYLNEKEVQLLQDWYAATVTYLDEELERFLTFYQNELQDDTILILVADHGEQLGEHGVWGHSHRLYEETLRVPLIMIGPDVPEGIRRSDFASHTDIFDTLCDLCDINPPESTDGESLFGGKSRDAVFMEYGERNKTEFATNSAHGRYLDDEQLQQFCAGRKAIRTNKYQYEITSTGSEHLFDLSNNTEISNPPSESTEHLRKRLLNTLGEQFGVWPESNTEKMNINQQVETNLRNLGYID